MTVAQRGARMPRLCGIGFVVLACTVAPMLAAQSTRLPLKPESEYGSIGFAVFKSLILAVLLLAAAAAGLYAWKRRRLPETSATGNVAANLEWARRVSPKTTLLVVCWQGRRYLLAESTGSFQLIDSRSLEEPPP